MSALRRDLHHALRRLLRERGFAATAIGILAVGIAACTGMYSIVQAVLLRPSGIGAPDRIVIMWPTQSGTPGEFTYDAVRDMRWRMRSFEDVAVVSSTAWGGAMAVDGDEPIPLSCAVVSGTFFEVLRARPILGRALRPDDDRPGAPKVAVISYQLWTTRFASDPNLIGRTVRIREEEESPVEIVGVMPAGTLYPLDVDYWTAAAPRLATIARRSGDSPKQIFEGLGVFHVIGRLPPGTSADALRAETVLFVKAVAADFKVDLSHMGVTVTPVVDYMFGRARPALLILFAGVLLLLLIACTNVAALLLARGASRGRELAVRASLGADRRRLIQQLMVESSVLAVASTVVGVCLAAATLRLLVSLSPSELSGLDGTAIDARVMTFTLGLCVATTVVLGVAPAWILSRAPLADALKKTSSGTTLRAGRLGFRQWLVSIQVAGTLVLLICTGLCIKSFARLTQLDLGFDPANVLTFGVSGLDESRYPSPEQRRQIVERLLTTFDRVPHVVAAGALSQRPFENGQVGWDTSFLLEGQVDRPESWSRNPLLNWETVAGDYFQSMGIRLVRGRVFDASDTSDARPVVIVSEAMAARVWPGQDPIGKRLRESFFVHSTKDGEPQWQTVVGVVATARYREIEAPRLDLYVPLRQGGDIQHFTVRTAIDPERVTATLGAALADVDKGLSLRSVATMSRIVGRTRGPWQFTMRVFSLFGGIALALASVGVFSLITYAAHQRRREIGVRMALGATRSSVVRLVLSRGLVPTVVGLGLGLGAATMVTTVLSSFLFHTSPNDPGTFVVVAAVLAIVIFLASCVPAQRAASLDPLRVLRDE